VNELTSSNHRARVVAIVLVTLLAAVLAALVADRGATAAGDTTTTTSSTGRPAPIIHLPNNQVPSHKVPLLIAFHGTGGSPTSMMRGTLFNPVADANDFVVAYLGSADQVHPWSPHVWPQDVPYVSATIDQLVASDNVDRSRVYVMGFSNGAAFTFKLGCALSSKIAAIVPVSGVMNPSLDGPCALTHPVAELSIIGSADGLINGVPPRVLSAAQTAATWRAMDGCQPSSAAARSQQPGPTDEQTWGPCTDGSEVGLNVIQGGTHIYPQDAEFPSFASTPDGHYPATSRIWAFLSGQRARFTVDASLSSLRVKSIRHGTRYQREVVAGFRLGGPMGIATDLLSGRRVAAAHAFRFASGGRAQAILSVSSKTRAGRYAVQFVLVDPYGRKLTIRRTVHIPVK
jgi:polyhydroxybutyrate depolymerase